MVYLRKTSRFFVPVMMIILACFIVNSNLNQHYHKLASGSIVKHAHPYKKDKSGAPFQSHHHTSFEFLLLDNISIAIFTVIAFFLALTIFPRYLKNIYSPIITICKQTDLYFLNNYHAPPITRL